MKCIAAAKTVPSSAMRSRGGSVKEKRSTCRAET